MSPLAALVVAAVAAAIGGAVIGWAMAESREMGRRAALRRCATGEPE